MTDTTYNGWSNRATWNVKLWLDNDEPTYREVQELQRHAESKKQLAEQVRELCEAIWFKGATPDGDRLSECDWDEIAENLWEDEDHEPTPTTMRGQLAAEERGQEKAAAEVKSENATVPLGIFVENNSIWIESHRVPKRPDGLMADSPRHFRCKLTSTKHKRHMSLYFSQGSAHETLPSVQDVLDCLASDATGYENAKTFEAWASEYGYDTDSRKAEHTFKAVKRQAEQLKRFLGAYAYEQLLYKTERL